MKEIAIWKVRLVRQNRSRETPQMSGPSDLARFGRRLIGKTDREEMWCFLLDAGNRIIGANRVSIGSLSSCQCHPRELMKAAILGNAESIVMLHNHPSGRANPSQEDIDMTRRLTAVGALLGITLLDHIVLGDTDKDDWISMYLSGKVPRFSCNQEILDSAGVKGA